LEPARGTFAWGSLDAAVKRVDVHDRLVVVIENTPKWAALTPQAAEEVWRHQPPELKGWQAFIAAAASRYRGRVAAWQPEPVLDFAVFRGTIVDYLGMLHAARLAVRQADPHALIVAASPPGLDLAYTKQLLTRAGDDFDVLTVWPKGRSPEDVLEALGTMHDRILTDPRHQLWVGAGGTASGPDAAVGDQMIEMAAVDIAGGAVRQFWSGRQLSSRWAPVREMINGMLAGARFVGWLPRGPGIYALIMTDGSTPTAVVWSASGVQRIAIASAGGLRGVGAAGPVPIPSSGEGASTVLAGPEPVFVQGLAPSVLAEAAQTAQQGSPRILRDAAHDFARADGVSVTLGAVDDERGLYNQRLRALRSGAVVPVTVDGDSAVRTDQSTDAVYVYLDVDHSFAYFVDGHEDLLITVEVHRARAARQIGFNLLYDSMTGYRFTPWQWIDPGTGWATYTVKLTDANFSSTWGWDFAINGAGDKTDALTVKSVTVRKVPRTK
ncbi:MAG TPA: hypothetical protein VJT32_08330, partial [bacterium]|nr:hypothetical protein [bacterium]